ncbi:MAG: radical SAM protein [Moorea sp. SIO1F2]|uniref:radical SAM protein n=1 Tax=unclassified Moorena TaxID=2683338 RepID=UPI0013BC1EA6|nr:MULTISPECIES: radical SAM protein [unclassified Moorena]NEN94800.1 radical SAM protein [Moorena sp. SIO3I7]NEO44065.1 radical SAM protein [Moorena sp. SIO4A3]NEO05747.1 radical SAM protein [Moorena sp. SIO3I8]NEO22857.1 radical SAM protein [Moorena sp. SIO4A5]NEP25082.1 radical SAM protein [Moorena sp. SIO3I6]
MLSISKTIENNSQTQIVSAHCSDYPQGLYIELTDRCNLLCPMCRQSAVAGDVLSLEVFKEIADALFPHARFVDLRGWGESTLLPNFEAYLDYAMRFPLQKKLITNATVNKPHLWQKLGEAGVIVGVSIDAADPELYEQLRVGAKLEKMLANVRQIIRAAETSGLDPKQQVYFCITASGMNLLDIKNIVHIGLDLGIDRFKLEPLKTSDGDPNHLKYHIQTVKAETAALKTLVEETGARIELSASLIEEQVYEPAVRKLCIHPWQYLYVNSRGRMGFCDHLNGVEEFTFANWSEGSFEDFWNGPEMVQLRKEHLARFNQGQEIAICGDCNWCYNRRYMDLEDMIDPNWSEYRVQL